ncbi:hypothetical protein M1523_03045 [Patescibacteria group bacterium]|nr:hypothetical protein [Patescibacteria group bacterium]MCL5091302.1 hypothetical protein [Patescibacteria group bacterium]
MERPIFKNVRVTVIDGAGCGEAVNKREQNPEDVGANSLLHASQRKPYDALALASIGIQRVPGLEGLQMVQPSDIEVKGAFGAAIPRYAGKGSPEGHQALMGCNTTEEFMFFDKTGFPPEVVKLVEETIKEVMKRDVQIVRNPETDDINGVKFINTPGIGDLHFHSGQAEDGPLMIPIYASSESLIQIPLHQGVVPQAKIEEIGKAVRKAVDEAGYKIGRIVMRPFVGGPSAGQFERISKDRRDYGVDPEGSTLIDHLKELGIPVYGVGKALSMLNYHGVNRDNVQKLDTDEQRLRAIVDDFARHDPTQTSHTNHTSENVPVLVYSPRIKGAIDLGARDTFADIAATVADNFGIADKIKDGKSFLGELV